MTPQEIETQLIQQEQAKWDAFARGDFGSYQDLFAEDFINIGWFPTGTLRQTKAEAFAPVDPSQLPPPMVGQIALSDFIVIHSTDDSAIVTYKVAAPFETLYVSSAWALRDGEWETVLYQASPLAPASAAPAPLAGLYQSPRADASGSDALLFNDDGSYAVDAGATGVYGTTGRYEVADDRVTFTDDERTDVPVCAGDVRSGTYQLVFDGSSFTLTPVDDGCAGRLGYFANRVWTK